MGAINLKMTLGTVNYTDWIHVTASKISAPSTIVYQTWIDVPVSSYNFIIPNLDPTNYYIRYYDSPTDVALGTLRLEMLVNAVTGETISERIFYTCGGSNPGDPADGTSHIIDPYLINKTVTGVFKEAFRYLEPVTDWEFDETTGDISNLTGVWFSSGEKISVEIKYSVANVDPGSTVTGGGIYSGRITVTTSTYTLSVDDIGKRVICLGSGATQVITMPSLATMGEDQGFYFDNSFGGVAMQVKIIFPGTDHLFYTGMIAASDLYSEFWVSKGEHLLVRKHSDSLHFLPFDYNGVRVGERMALVFNGQPGWLSENGALYDGDEYGRLWWYINNQLPATHVITDDNVTSISYAHPEARQGQFVKHSTLKKFRVPNTQNLSERGLLSFSTYGADEARTYDYPGGFQDEMVMPHVHPNAPLRVGDVDRGGGSSLFSLDNLGATSENSGTEQRVKNIGVIYAVHI